jgi:hypothetical protein
MPRSQSVVKIPEEKLQMATKAKAKKTTAKEANGKSKTATVLAMLRKPNGVTRAQVLSMVDWQAV